MADHRFPTPRRAVSVEEVAAGLNRVDADDDAPKPGDGLTPRQKAFCVAMLHAGSAAEAARLAGYSPDNARQQASRLLQDSRVIARLKALRRANAARPASFLPTALERLDDVYRSAINLGDHRAAIKALETQIALSVRFGGDAEAAATDADVDLYQAMCDYTAAVHPSLAEAKGQDVPGRQQADTRRRAADTAGPDADESRRMPTYADAGTRVPTGGPLGDPGGGPGGGPVGGPSGDPGGGPGSGPAA